MLLKDRQRRTMFNLPFVLLYARSILWAFQQANLVKRKSRSFRNGSLGNDTVKSCPISVYTVYLLSLAYRLPETKL